MAIASPRTGRGLTVRIEVGGLVAPDSSLFFLTLDAINVGYMTVPYGLRPRRAG